ncbi:MAG: extracellular solute-binding protein, partial [Candidatus Tectomicrobia bacterium]
STAYHDLLTQKLKNKDSSMDVYFIDVIWPAEFAAAGWALPLDDLFPPSDRKQFLPATIEADTYQDHIHGVPSRIDSGMLYYCKDLLDQYGFDPPQTWEELVHQATTILKGEQNSQPGFGIGKINGLLGVNRKNKRAFWASGKVPKKQRGVNRANQRSQNEGVSACEKGLTGPCAKDVAKDWDTLWRFRWVRAKGECRLRD